MTHRLVLVVALAMLTTLSSTPARGAVGSVTTFDTVDAIEAFFLPAGFERSIGIKVTGVLSGDSAPTTLQFRLINSGAAQSIPGSVDPVARCDRMAMLAMSKPGKFQFALVETDISLLFTCKLIVRTP